MKQASLTSLMTAVGVLGVWLALVQDETMRLKGLALFGSALSLVLVGLPLWAWRRHTEQQTPSPPAAKPQPQYNRRRFARWLSWLTWTRQGIGLSVLFVAILWMAVENELLNHSTGYAAAAPPLVGLLAPLLPRLLRLGSHPSKMESPERESDCEPERESQD